MKNTSAFTLVELLIVIGILAILSVAAVLVLNPAEFLAGSRDTTRVNDMKTIEKAISAAIATGGLTDNTQPNRVYVSLPDTNGDTLCTEYTNLPALSGGWEYRCTANAANLQNVNGSGWIPMDLTSLTGMNPPLSNLPVDPENTEENYYAYSQGSVAGTYALAAPVESTKYQGVASGDGGSNSTLFETAPVTYFAASFTCGTDTVQDSEGNAYATVLIGTQCWTRGNLNIGTRVNAAQAQTDNGVVEKYCFGDLASNCTTWGGLYLWDELMRYATTEGGQGLCPAGWHIPTDTEFKTLEMFLGMNAATADATGWRGTDQGTQLKQGGSSGFDGLPSGERDIGGSTMNSDGSFFWTSTLRSADHPWMRQVRLANTTVYRNDWADTFGLSVRCLMD